MKRVILRSDRDDSLKRRHPWIFSGAVARVDGAPERGETVAVLGADGTALGVGAWSPDSQIRVRMWSFDPATVVSDSFFADRIERALEFRRALPGLTGCTAYRLVSAEGDGLPGVVADRYADFVVCQFLSAGAERWKREIVAALARLVPGCRGVFERSDSEVRGKENLPVSCGPVQGDCPPPLLEVQEAGSRFWVDVAGGHKTGWYLDQRDNRRKLQRYTGGADVLNCFCYSGGFTVAACAGGARHVTSVDASAPALELLQRNAELNGIPGDRLENLQGDVFQVLRRFRDQGRTFDGIILDPPKFADSKAMLERAARGYKDINLLAFKLLRPGGTLVTFSCSGLMTAPLFQKIVADAALDAGRDAAIVEFLSQSPDHTIALPVPESHYLKGLVCRAR